MCWSARTTAQLHAHSQEKQQLKLVEVFGPKANSLFEILPTMPAPIVDKEDTVSERLVWADFVEKLRNSDIAIFGQKPIILRNQVRSFVRRRELACERRKANLAEPLATKSSSSCKAKKFAVRSHKRSFSTE
jgi:hypothetical protein